MNDLIRCDIGRNKIGRSGEKIYRFACGRWSEISEADYILIADRQREVDNKYEHLYKDVFSQDIVEASLENINILLHYLNGNDVESLPKLSVDYTVFKRIYNGYPATYLHLDKDIWLGDESCNKFRVGDYDGVLSTYYPI